MHHNTRILDYPDHNADVKDREWLLQYAQAMWGDYHSGEFHNYKRQIQVNRQYAKGKQDTGIYKKQLAGDEKSSFMNIDWKVPKVANRIVDVVIGILSDISKEVVAESVDPMGRNAKIEYEHKLRAMMQMQKRMQESQLFQQSMEGNPQNDEELEIHMMDYKQSSEIAIESALQKTLEYNDFWTKIKPQVERDIFRDGIGGVKIEIASNRMVKYRRINPMNLVISKTREPDLSDLIHEGELVYYTIGQLRQMPGAEAVSEKEWKAMAKEYRGQYGNPYDWYQPSDQYISQGGAQYNSSGVYHGYDRFKVAVLDFECKTVDRKTREKKEKNGRVSYHSRPNSWEPPKNSKYKREKVQKVFEVRYKGKWILGSKVILDYGKCGYMARGNKSDGEYGKVMSSFVLFSPSIDDGDMEITSHVERMIPHIDALCNAWYKLQNVIATAIPKGFAIDDASLVSVAKILGLKDPLELVRFYQQKGIVVYSMDTIADTGVVNQKPIQELENGLGRDFMHWIAIMEHAMQMIQKVTGIGEGLDATVVDPNKPVSTVEMSANASIKSLKPITDGMTSIQKRISLLTTKKIQLLIYEAKQKGIPVSRHLSSIGELAMGSLEVVSMFQQAEFDFRIIDTPSEQEMAELTMSVNIALEQQQINVADRMEVLHIAKTSRKKAIALLKLRIKKNQEMAQQMQMQQIEENAKQQQASADQAHQYSMDQIGAQSEAKVGEIQLQGHENRRSLLAEYKLKRGMEGENNNHDTSLTILQGEIDKDLEEIKAKNRPKPQTTNKTAKKK